MMRLRLSGGDGDPEYLEEMFIAERVSEDWFPGALERGPAWLTKIVTGRHCGEYLALTSRMKSSLEEQLSARDVLSVVIQILLKPGPGFIETYETAPAIAMALFEVIDQ